jgi:hypothetical protein
MATYRIGRVTACVHCGVPVLYDNYGQPIHCTLSYVCKDRCGQIMPTYATPGRPDMRRVPNTPLTPAR